MTFRYRVRTNTGCSHYGDEPCNRCWWEGDGRHGHFQGRPPHQSLGAYVMPGFPEDLMLENAFDPWDRVQPVSSREEMRRLCERQGVDSLYLKESTVWRSGPTRWV